MPIRARCSNCQKIVSAPDKYAGRQAKYPGCGGRVVFPALPEDPQTVPSPSISMVDSSKDSEDQQERIACPYCAELIVATARKCRFCGEFLDDTVRTVPQDSSPPNQPGPERSDAPVKTGIDEALNSLFFSSRGTASGGFGVSGSQ